MPCKPWLTDAEREAHKRETILRIREARHGIYGAKGQGGKAKDALLDEGEDIMPLVQRGDNRLRSNLGEGSRWHRATRPYS